MIWNPLTGQVYHECWGDVAFRVVSGARVRGINRRVKFWIEVRVLSEVWPTE
jgi:hypothetical protein